MAVRFGIVGLGFMGHVHLKMLSGLDGASVSCVCDIDPAQLTDVPSGIATCTEASELMARGDVDVVLIAANNDQHKMLALMAAAAGKHVLCEKPVALSIGDFDEMAAACEAAGVTFTVHQQRRFDRDYRISKQVLDSGTLGNAYTVKSSLYGFNGNMHDWHIYKDQGGGMLWDWGVHLIDQMLWMIPGRIASVYADLRNVINREVDDYFKILMRFENGILAEIELGTYYLGDKDGWFERHWFIGGDKGSMILDGFEPKGHIIRTSQLLTSVPGGKTMTASGPTRSFGPPPPGRVLLEPLPQVDTHHVDFFRNYLAAVKGESEFLVMLPEVRRVLRLMDAVRGSATSGRSVDFE